VAENPNGSTEPDGRFEKVLAQILQAEEAGKRVDLSRVVQKFPDLESALRDYFRNRDGFDRLAPCLAPTPPAADDPAEPPDLAPGSRFAGYDIVCTLGRGGMGVVYLAEQRDPRRRVALKLVRTDRLAHLTRRQRQAWLDRFHGEGQKAASVTDDCVVPVYEVGAVDGHPFYSMRYVEGQTLAAAIEAGPLWKNRRVAALMEQVARAVQAIHEQGLLHRDLKPHNIIVDSRGRPYVTDFGLAKWLDVADGPTHTGEVLGSPPYMSPEQAEDSTRVSEATDVYGLGATLYALLTGRPPFRGATDRETLHQVMTREPVPPGRLNPAVDQDLETITLACLEKEPERRYDSAAEVADELRRYLDGAEIERRPLGPVGRLVRWCRRKPVLTALSVTAAMLLVVAGTFAILHRIQVEEAKTAQRNADDAEQERVAQEKEAERQKKLAEEAGRQRKAKEELARKADEERKRQEGLRANRDYFDDMRKAQRFVEEGDFDRARQTLRQHLPAPGADDRRGWEWHFLNAQCRESGFAVNGRPGQGPVPGGDAGLSVGGHPTRVLAVAWSPDGTRLASADDKGTIMVWDLAQGKPPRKLTAQASGVYALAWSPDGTRLASASQGIPQSVAVPPVPPAAPQPPAQRRTGGTPAGGRGPQPGVAGGQRPTDAGQGTLKIWDVDAGKVVKTLRCVPDNNPGLAFPSRPGEPFVDRTVFLTSWTQLLLWDPGGKELALADADGKIQIWDAGTGKRLHLLKAHVGGVHSAAWNPDGRLASAGGDNQLKIWDAATRKAVVTLPLRSADDRMPTPAYALVWAADGKRLSVAARDEIRVVDADAGKVAATRKLVPRDPLLRQGLTGTPSRRFVWGPGGVTLASIQTALFSEVKTWDPTTGAEGTSIDTPRGPSSMGDGACSPAWDSRGRRLALGWSNGTVVARPVGSGRGSVREAVRSPAECALAWSADPRYLLSAPDWSSDPGNVPVGMENTAEVMKALAEASQKGIGADPSAVLKAANKPPRPRPEKGHQIQVRDAVTGEVVRLLGDGVRPRVLAASPDGKWVADVTDHPYGSVRLWPVGGGEAVVVNVPTPPAKGEAGPAPWLNDGVLLAWSPDSRRLAFTKPGQASVVRWDVVARATERTLERDGRPLRALCWAPVGKRLAWADEDGNGTIWDVESGKPAATFTYGVRPRPNPGTRQPLAASMLSWCPDGKRLAVAGQDETVSVVDAETGNVLRALRGHASAFDLHDVICAVAWSPDGKRLAWASPDGSFLLSDTETWQEVVTLRPASARPFAKPNFLLGSGGVLAWSRDGKQLAYFSADGNRTIWDGAPEEDKPHP
jgi:WD40 repeat protein